MTTDLTTDLESSGWVVLRRFGAHHTARLRQGHLAASFTLCDKNRTHPTQEHAQLILGNPWDRYHVRVWDVPALTTVNGADYHDLILSANTVAAAHHEIFDLLEGHRVTSHESGKWKVATDIGATPNAWHVQHEAEITGNWQLQPFCNEKATVLERGPS